MIIALASPTVATSLDDGAVVDLALRLSGGAHGRLRIRLGGTPIGAPIVGWVANHFGPRWALGVGAASGFVAAVVGVYALARRRP